MKFTTLPLLVIAIVSFVVIVTHRLKKRSLLTASEARSIYVLLAVLVLLGIINASLALKGIYTSAEFLSLLPGLWLPLVPIILTISGVLLFPSLRAALRALVDHTPPYQLIYLHALRILAIGSILKAIGGEFPEYFAYFIGIPDMLFGLSALLVGTIAYRSSLSHRSLLIWHLMGASIIALPAAPLLQMGLPGPIQIFTSEPTAQALFEFPMVIAPSLIVPWFLLFNLMVIWRLLETSLKK
ncbi:hypothetical protein PN36_08085 [Candidatus Thiomargarita nelsonii]|uniref:Uncharacterized protein n=1 Tax=Candidatus Thiomargarita nelsonii TaxID=1003181 RepID=A0A0A6P4V0_9GAMM|nr:hypothetical protein PN36_08085 [Candidatus Thiomargarita nelsonii]